MTISIKDRIKQGTNTAGSGTVTLHISYSASGFQDFSVLGNGAETYYAIEEAPSKWEVGIGTYNAGTLSRDTIFSSSNSNNKVSFGGSGTVFVTYPAEKAVFADSENNVNITGLVVGTTGVKFNDGTIQTTAASGGGTYTAGTGLQLAGTEFNAISSTTGISGIVRLQDSATDGTIDRAITPNAVYDISGVITTEYATSIQSTGNTLAINLAATGATNAAAIASKDNYDFWKIRGDSSTSTNISSEEILQIAGAGTISVDLNSGSNRITVSGSGVDLSPYATIVNLAATGATNASNISTNDIDISNLSGLVSTNTTNISTNDTDISNLSGLVSTNTTNISMNDTDISNLSGLVSTNTTNISTTGATNAANIAIVSGIATGKDNYQYWTVTDGSNSDNILPTGQVKFTGAGNTTVSYGANTVTISGTSSDLSSYATTSYVTGVSGDLQTQITDNIYTWQATGINGSSPTGITISQGDSLSISGASGVSVNLSTGTPNKFVVTHNDTSALGPGGFSLTPNDFLTKVQVDEYGHVTGLGFGAVTGVGGSSYSFDVSDGSNSESVANGDTITWSGTGATTVAYNTGTNTFVVNTPSSESSYTQWVASDGTTTSNLENNNQLRITGAGNTTVSLVSGSPNIFTVSGTDYTAGTGLALIGTEFSTAGTGTFDVLDMTVLAEASYPPHQEGVLFYDEDNHTLTLFNDEADISLQVGQEQYIRVRNNTAATITNGSAVRIAGSHGNIAPEIALASADTNDKSLAAGLATHSIEANSFGYVTVQGTVRGINTSSFTAGQDLFLSTVSGGLTGVSPVLPNYANSLGTCIRSHTTQGSVLVALGKQKLGGGDVKSTAVVNVSGIPFFTQKANGYAGGVETDAYLAYDSGNTRIELGAGGIKFNDGTTQTTAPVAGGSMSYWNATDGTVTSEISNGNNVRLTGAGNTTVSFVSGSPNVFTISGTDQNLSSYATVTNLASTGATNASAAATNAGNISTNTSNLAATGATNAAAIASKDNYQYWTITDGGTSENISTTSQVKFTGGGATTVAYSAGNNTLTVTTPSAEAGYDGWTATDGTVTSEIANGNDVRFTGAGNTTVSFISGSPNVFTISGSDVDTNYTDGTGLLLVGTEFNVSGIDSSMIVNGSVANIDLVNDSVSYGGISLALGGTDTTPAFDLADATNYPTASLVGTITNAQLAGSIVNTKLVNDSVTITAGSGLSNGGEIDLGATKVIDITPAGVTNAMLAGSITNAKLTNDSVSYGGISLALGGTDATPAFDLADATNYPTASLVGTITNAQLAGSIVNTKLVNDSVSYGGISLDLGGTDATPAFNLSDATSYPTTSLVGTITNAQLAGSISESKLATDVTLDAITDNGATTTNNITVGTVTAPVVKTTFSTVTFSATPAFNLDTASTFSTTMTANITSMSVSNSVAGMKFIIRLVQDGTGSRTAAWFTTVKWAEGGTAPTLTTTAGKTDVFGFLCTSVGNFEGFVIGQDI